MSHSTARALLQWHRDAVARHGARSVRKFIRENTTELRALAADLQQLQKCPKRVQKRIKHNIAALSLLKARKKELTAGELAILERFSGWGGLPAECLPAGYSGVDEYYTPPKLARAIGLAIRPLVAALGRNRDVVRALEPAAGTGRLIRGVEHACPRVPVSWTIIEPEKTPARILRILRPHDKIVQSTFEEWDREQSSTFQGSCNLVVANPPYGSGVAHEGIPAEYREGPLYAYFLRRCLDLLAPGGIGVFLVPRSFAQSEIRRALRTRIVARSQLLAAYRLPRRVFDGVDMHVDLIVLRARAGRLHATPPAEQYFVDGNYFDEHADHVLHSPISIPEIGEDSCRAVSRGRIPTLQPPTKSAAALAMGERLAALRALCKQPSVRCHGLWRELVRDLEEVRAWVGNPWEWCELDGEGADAFRDAFTRRGELAAWLTRGFAAPEHGRHGLGAHAAWLYETHGSLSVDTLLSAHPGTREDVERLSGWVVDGDTLIPEDEYFRGDLFARLAQAKDPALVQRIREVIDPVPVEDIELSPRLGWVPLELASAWVAVFTGEAVTLARTDTGRVIVAELPDDPAALPEKLADVVAWMNFEPNSNSTDYERDFEAWVADNVQRREIFADAYNRAVRGFRCGNRWGNLPDIPRWGEEVSLHPYQADAASQILAVRCGVLAFEAGLGKTFAALAVLAAARHLGEARRPVVVVPLSLVWQWYASIKEALPDYRVCVIGCRPHRTRGGHHTSKRDTRDQRHAKWSAFCAGAYDVAIVTMPVLEHLGLSDQTIQKYERTILQRGEFEPPQLSGELGFEVVDCLIVDEIAAFKNLWAPSDDYRPRYMGVPDKPSQRAQRLHALAFAVRLHATGRVVGLTANPAKNSPLELFNIIDTVHPKLWQRAGIHSPMAFLERYVKVERVAIPNSKSVLVQHDAATGFKNLHELWGLVCRVVAFQSAADCDVKLPVPRSHVIEVKLDTNQRKKTKLYRSHLRRHPRDFLGVQVRLSLVAVHAELDGGYTWDTAEHVEPVSPKFEAVAQRVAAGSCAHIIFVESPAAQRWLREVLIRHGIPADRVGVLNGSVPAAERQAIAQAFNQAQLNVVIANSVAHEGLDLQGCTCGIHHVDLPWGPAELAQRNGRAIRQRNPHEAVEIYYYVAAGSVDRYRLAMISGKAGWLSAMRCGADQVSNPAATLFIERADLLLHLTDESSERERLLEQEAKWKREQDKRRAQSQAARLAYRAAARFRDARESNDTWISTKRHTEGLALLRKLDQVDARVWPWSRWMSVARDVMPMISASGGAPVWDGLCVHRQGVHYQFGRVAYQGGTVIGVRAAGAATWVAMDADDVAQLGIRPPNMPGGSRVVPWPKDDDVSTVKRIRREAKQLRSTPWPAWGWCLASERWVSKIWPQVRDVVTRHLQQSKYHLPVLRDTIELVTGDVGKSLLPPTRDGWETYKLWSAKSGLPRNDLSEVARYWWGRDLPRGNDGAKTK